MGEEGERTIPKERQSLLKWNGWGYRDCKFFLTPDEQVSFTGARYGEISGKLLPNLKAFMVNTLGASIDYKTPSQEAMPSHRIPASRVNDGLMGELKKSGVAYSLDGQDRLFRAHGHTLHDLFSLRYGSMERIPDVVVFPSGHDDVVKLVEMANRHDVVIIPFGGGTNVTGAVECPAGETRMILSLDTSQMTRILWIDEENLTARVEAGIIGQDLERELGRAGFCTGHEPDSFEFSSLGGWVATRASGMKRSVYGNIEDMVVSMKVVTARGVFEKNCLGPRVSTGPDLHHFILGSEGTLGVVTEVTLRINQLPPCTKYGSIVFPDFASGVKCLRECTRDKCCPSSIRLLDNPQFLFGQALKPEAESFYASVVDSLKRFYLTKWRRFDVGEMCVATLLFEGSRDKVAAQEKRVYEMAARFGGLPGGEENGRRGYLLTFVIAYLRDMGLEFSIASESFETSVPWDKVLTLTHNVKRRVEVECKRRGVLYPPYISCRVTQCYDAGACVYFYLAFNYRGLARPVEVYDEIEGACREEIMCQGGSLSHHHGVGKIRKRFLPQAVTPVGLGALRAVKTYLDPNNIFNNGNLMCTAEEKSKL